MKSSIVDDANGSCNSSCFYTATTTRLLVKRNGHSLLRSAGIPKPVVLVDTRERQPLPLLANHRNWIAGERRVALKTGDYSVAGMESLLALERKSLADLVDCTITSRARFLACCQRLSKLRWKAILIEASYEDIKLGWDTDEIPSDVHPNCVCGLLDAVEAKFGIPILLTLRHRELATERAASWLSKHFTYWWLDQHGYGRVLIDGDKL
jgi:ERCC4-type nuclease